MAKLNDQYTMDLIGNDDGLVLPDMPAVSLNMEYTVDGSLDAGIAPPGLMVPTASLSAELGSNGLTNNPVQFDLPSIGNIGLMGQQASLPGLAPPAAPLPNGTIGAMGDYLKQGFWDFFSGGTYRSYNMGATGTGANNGVIYYDYDGYAGTIGGVADADGLTAARQALVDDVLDYIGQITGINFIHDSAPSGGVDLYFRDSDSGAYAGSSIYGSGNGTAGHRYIGYSFVNVANSWSGGTSDVNDYTYQTFMHEIFHALGLGHQGSYNGTVNFITDSTAATSNNNVFLNDSWQMSVMSYISQSQNTTIPAGFNYVISAMAADMEALRDYYGYHAFTGDTVYGFNTNILTTDSETFANLSTWADETAFTIADDGGIDTVDFSGYAANQLINLQVVSDTATVSSISNIGGQTGNMTLAVGTIIENAKGGSGNDTIYGNDADNTLTGNGGNDTIYAGNSASGGDYLYGGDGSDALYGGDGFDYLYGGAGTDTMEGGAGTDWVSYLSAGGAETVNLAAGTATGAEGSDTLTGIENVDGTNFNDTLTGDGNDNRLVGEGGNDVINGGLGVDRLEGNAGTDTINGEAGNDLIIGGIGADTMDGGADTDTLSYAGSSLGVTVDLGANTASGGDATGDVISNFENLTGSDHDDDLTGTGGANVISGGAGNDTITDTDGGTIDVFDGGTGIDTLVTTANWNDEVLYDLAAGNMSYLGFIFDTITNFENLTLSGNADASGDNNNNVITFTGVGTNTINGLGGDDTIDAGSDDDTVIGGAGADTMDGGAGTDTLSYAGSDAAVAVYLATGFADGGHATGDVISNFENLVGSDHNDVLGSNIGNNVINGGAGTDLVSYYYASGVVTVDLGLGTAAGADGNDTLVSIEAVEGSDGFGDSLTGDANANTLVGFGGDDMLSGGGGIDVLLGGSGADSIYGGDGGDQLQGDDGDDVLSGGAGDDFIGGGAGTDTVSYLGAGGAVTVSLLTNSGTGADGNDTFGSIENIEGSDGFGDTLTGDGNANVVNGNGGDDTIMGGVGADTMDGGAGTDTLSYADAASAVKVNMGTGAGLLGEALGDVISNFENLLGSAHNDILFGNAGANGIQGGDGDDIIRGGGSGDTMDGGAGTGDMLSYAGSNGAVTVNLGANTASGGHATGDVISNFEKVYGSNFGDDLAGSAGDDQLSGGKGNDIFLGGAGADAIYGGGGLADVISYSGSSAGVTIDLANKTASGGDATGDVFAGIERAIGSSHDDTLLGSAANNQLLGGDGDDTLRGGAGADNLFGGNGTDLLSYAGSDAGVTVDIGNNTASGGHAAGDLISGFESIFGSGFGDTLIGSVDANVLSGSGGNDDLQGFGGDDIIDGGANNDRIDGGGGHDTLTGGFGLDTFVLGYYASGSDFITDFSTVADQLEVSAADFGGGLVAGALAASQFAANATGLAGDADDRFILNTVSGELFFDINGTGAGGNRLIATFTGVIPALTASDFDIV